MDTRDYRGRTIGDVHCYIDNLGVFPILIAVKETAFRNGFLCPAPDGGNITGFESDQMGIMGFDGVPL